jgi:hypothetical protein
VTISFSKQLKNDVKVPAEEPVGQVSYETLLNTSYFLQNKNVFVTSLAKISAQKAFLIHETNDGISDIKL